MNSDLAAGHVWSKRRTECRKFPGNARATALRRLVRTAQPALGANYLGPLALGRRLRDESPIDCGQLTTANYPSRGDHAPGDLSRYRQWLANDLTTNMRYGPRARTATRSRHSRRSNNVLRRLRRSSIRWAP